MKNRSLRNRKLRSHHDRRRSLPDIADEFAGDECDIFDLTLVDVAEPPLASGTDGTAGEL